MNLFTEGLEKPPRRAAIPVHTQMREHEWAEQPTPHSTLVIRAVTLSTTPAIMSLVTRFALRQAAQSVRSKKSPGANIDNRFLLLRGERAVRQRSGKNLVWSNSAVVSNSRSVDDVVAVSGRAVPKFV